MCWVLDTAFAEIFTVTCRTGIFFPLIYNFNAVAGSFWLTNSITENTETPEQFLYPPFRAISMYLAKQFSFEVEFYGRM
jgi:hypothetical protein